MAPEPSAAAEHLPDPSAGDTEEPRLSVAAAARRLGVAPATLRTWDRRYGIGPSGHESGRHRRYSADDLARLELMQQHLVRGVNPAEAARFALTARLPHPERPGRPRIVTGPPAPGPDTPDAAPDEADGAGTSAVGDPLLAGTDGPGELGSRVRVGGRVLRLPGGGRRARGLGRAALALDAAAARSLLAEAIAAAGAEAAWETVARPVLVAVADRWASTGAGVEIEHMLSQCITSTFSARGAALPAADGRPVLLAGMPGEHHVLPLAALGAVLAEHGCASRSLGADLPFDALVAALRRTAPAALVLWSQLPPTADVAVLRALPRTRPRARVFAAGPGWAGVELPPAVGWLNDLSAAAAAVAATSR